MVQVLGLGLAIKEPITIRVTYMISWQGIIRCYNGAADMIWSHCDVTAHMGIVIILAHKSEDIMEYTKKHECSQIYDKQLQHFANCSETDWTCFKPLFKVP